MGLFDKKGKKAEETVENQTVVVEQPVAEVAETSPVPAVEGAQAEVSLDNNPFVETPTETEVVETPTEPEVSFDNIFNASPGDLIMPKEQPVNNEEAEVAVPVMEETAATVDSPQPLAEVDLNVNPEEMVGEVTKEDEITQIVSDSVEEKNSEGTIPGPALAEAVAKEPAAVEPQQEIATETQEVVEDFTDIAEGEVIIPDAVKESQAETEQLIMEEQNGTPTEEIMELSSEPSIEPAFVVPQEGIMSTSDDEESIISVPPLKTQVEETVSEEVTLPEAGVAVEEVPVEETTEEIVELTPTAPEETVEEVVETPVEEVPVVTETPIEEVAQPEAVTEQVTEEVLETPQVEGQIVEETPVIETEVPVEQPAVEENPIAEETLVEDVSETPEVQVEETVEEQTIEEVQPEVEQTTVEEPVAEEPATEEVIEEAVEVPQIEEQTVEEIPVETEMPAEEVIVEEQQEEIPVAEVPVIPEDIELPAEANIELPIESENKEEVTEPVITEEEPIIAEETAEINVEEAQQEETPVEEQPEEKISPIIEEDETVILPVISEDMELPEKDEEPLINEKTDEISISSSENESTNSIYGETEEETQPEEIQPEENEREKIYREIEEEIKQEKPQLTERDGIVTYISDPTPTRFCNNCGIMLTDDSSICPSCGEPID